MTGWRDLAELVRAPAALSVPGDVIAGAAAAGTLRPRTLALAGASVCLYWAGMAANDLADRKIDAVERPGRPIPSGRVRPGTALGVAVALTGAGVTIAALAGGRRAAAVAVPLAGAIWAYDLVAKQTAAGPAVMAACRGLDVLLGAGTGRRRAAVPAACTVAAHTYLITLLSRRETTGATAALPASTLAGTAVVAGAAASPTTTVGGLLSAWYAARFGAAQQRALTSPDATTLQGAVTAGITAFPALQGALTARAGRPVAGVAVAGAALLAGPLARKVSPT
ncbi:transferase [Actinoplanes lobatus]|uniref:Transferase n=1 Tax=Actinoplanes lobatus TaxID=113568 RepID=A0A7W7HMP2_9ACTN|nr:UbiA family prenyltransferase [Actinoplanes lobatus]MBB4753353.1 4-hydroxybenzoate polyprenyltransferase [Actinoplanes lobatus]GGN59766.1 transferase [Actinoplanes lobatus]GIE37887.1 transferase [Actinoplanes lobatus]